MNVSRILFIITLCAVLPGCTWFVGQPETHTVTYDGNGNNAGTVPVDSKVYEEGDSVTVLGNTGNLLIDGGAFLQWNTKADGTGKAYAAGATFEMGTSNVVLYAEYTELGAQVLNFTGAAKLYSNIVVGTAHSGESDVESVECSLDGGAFSEATGTSGWSFAVPSGTAAWRTGTLHTLSVRVTEAGGSATVTDFSFIRGEYRDFNGDGYRDLFIAAPKYGADQGRIYVIFGGENGPPSRDIQTEGADITLTASSTAIMQLGYGLAIGDFNGDGYADIAATENGYATYTGRAYVVHGGPDWTAQTIAVDVAADTIITGESSYDYFGYHAGSGDLDSDGIDDLFVGAHSYGDWQGRMYGFYGAAGGIVATLAASADFHITGENNADLFAASPQIGDFNGDGYQDLYVAASGYPGVTQTLHRGRAYIFSGNGARFASIDLSVANSADTTISGTANDDKLANARIADLDKDGYDDLVIQEVGVPENRGINYVFYGSAPGIPDTDFSAGGSADYSVSGENDGGSLGVLIPGDINGDGHPDLIGSSSTSDASAGSVYILSGGTARLSGEDSLSSEDVLITGALDDYISIRNVDDLNCDGYDDLVLGTCYWITGVDIPEVRIVYGSASGIPALDFSTDSADVVISGTAAGNYFNWRVF